MVYTMMGLGDAIKSEVSSMLSSTEDPIPIPEISGKLMPIVIRLIK